MTEINKNAILRVNIPMNTLVSGQEYERKDLRGYGFRVISGAPFTHIYVDRFDERFSNELSIMARRGNQWFGAFEKLYIACYQAVPSGNVAIEIMTDPKGVMVDDSQKYLYPNDYFTKVINLGVLRADQKIFDGGGVAEAECVTFTIKLLTGNIGFKFDDVTKDLHSYAPLIYPAMITINQDITKIFVTNAIQAGLSCELYLGTRV